MGISGGWHCVHVSDGCRNCYSETLSKRFGTGLDYKAGHSKDVRAVLNDKELASTLKLDKKLAKTGETARLFVGDMNDNVERETR